MPSKFNTSKWKEARERLVTLLINTAPGEVIGMNVIASVVGSPVTSSSFVVQSALKHALRTGASFDAIPGSGYRRNSNVAGLNKSSRELLFGQRKIKRSKRILDGVDQSRLEPADRLRCWGVEAKQDAALRSLRSRNKAIIETKRVSLFDEALTDLRKKP